MGYRYPRGHGELRLGILNLTGEDYRLNPLSAYTTNGPIKTITISTSAGRRFYRLISP